MYCTVTKIQWKLKTAGKFNIQFNELCRNTKYHHDHQVDMLHVRRKRFLIAIILFHEFSKHVRSKKSTSGTITAE